MSSIVEGLIVELQNLRISTYMTLAGLTLITYDWFLTLGDEVDLIWTGRLTTVKCIYLFNRYTVPFVIAVDAFNYVGPGFSSLTNHLTTKLYCLVIRGCYMDCYVIWLVAMRVWSIYGRSKRVLYFLSVLFFACETTTLVIALKASIQMIPSIQPLPIANVCFAVIPRFFSFVWAPNLVLELVVFIMMIVKATEHTKAKVVTPILSALYRDGVLYFFIIVVSGLFNLLVWALAPSSDILLAKFFTFGLVNVAAFRLVLDLREVGQAVSHTPVSNGDTNTHILRQFGTTSNFSLLSRPTTSYQHQTPSYPYSLRLGTESVELKPRAQEIRSPENSWIRPPVSSPAELAERTRVIAFDPATTYTTPAPTAPRYNSQTRSQRERGEDPIFGKRI